MREKFIAYLSQSNVRIPHTDTMVVTQTEMSAGANVSLIILSPQSNQNK
jgi:mannitol/fructose-specific phosphotransferase system IIA component (Ntr-type)